MKIHRRQVMAVSLLVALLLLLTACDSAPYKAAEEGDVAKLVELAEDTSKDYYSVREVAVVKLGELATPEAVDALLDWAENGAPPDLESDVLAALGATGDPRAIEPLLAALETVDRSKQESDLEPGEPLKLWSIMRGLSNLPDPRVTQVLLAELDAGHAEALSITELASALEGQGESIAPELEKRLASSDELVFAPAARALGSMYQGSGNQARLAELLAGPDTFRIYEGIINGDGYVDQQLVIDSLNTVGDVRMATEMLNSDSAEYETAAREWARAHGYNVEEWIAVP